MAADDAGQTGEERLAQWVREHARAVRGYLLGMVRRADVADDLLQDVFQRAWQARERYREEGHERAYLLRIADRLVIDRSRQLGREIHVNDLKWQEVEPAADYEMPLDELARHETNEELTAALDQLTAGQKRVLLQEMRNGLANSPAMDNKCGLWVVIEALRRAAKRDLKVALFAASTVAEEIGLRGAQTSAYGIDPQVGIAVDVTHATDCPTIDKRQQGEVNLGGGPVIVRGPNMNPVVVERLIALAQKLEMPHQLTASGRAQPNDSNALQINRAGVATGLVSIPNRYMHSAVEMISLEDIDRAAELLAEFLAGLNGDEDFRP